MIRTLLPFLLLLIFPSCHGAKENAKEEDPEKGVTAEVTVKDHTQLDGCQYLLLTGDQEKLNPLNLDKEYFEDGLQLRVRYEKADAMTTCMAGTNVRLLEVEERE